MTLKNYWQLTKEQQRLVLNQVSERAMLPAQAIEKDLWVSTLLQLVFTLPIAEHLVFKGGTSLSKVWGLIDRFSEDIDLAIDRSVFDMDGDLTKKEIKKLRKASSLYIRNEFYPMLQDTMEIYGLQPLCHIEVEPDGICDSTYPEPRKIIVHYDSVLSSPLPYLRPTVQLEIGARSLMEPYEPAHIKSIIEQHVPAIQTHLVDAKVNTSTAEKTFLEKAFLLHELFSVEGNGTEAARKSRHLYDLYQMMNKGIATKAIANDTLWESIRHHRSLLTSVRGMDYADDIRQHIALVPRADIIDVWRKDYQDMCEAMIYGNKPSFDELISEMQLLTRLFREKS